MPTQRRTATEAEATALASGIRLRIIRLTRSEALTNKELAERLGRDPATTLHHVRKLVDTGFLVPQPARKGNRGAKEIPYRSTGLSWTLEGAGNRRDIAEAMLQAYLAEISEIEVDELRQSRLAVQVRPEDRAEFESRLDDLLDEFATKPLVEGGERIAIYVAMYPNR